MTLNSEFASVKAKARPRLRIRYFDDFAPGQMLSHHWGRTITESDNLTFSALTLNYKPSYFNIEYARAVGHDRLVANPMLVALIAIGLSVQDLSEAGGAFLGISDLVFHRPVLVGETLVARSEVLERRPSASKPDMGIVTWRTTGFCGADTVLTYRRTNLLPRRPAGSEALA